MFVASAGNDNINGCINKEQYLEKKKIKISKHNPSEYNNASVGSINNDDRQSVLKSQELSYIKTFHRYIPEHHSAIMEIASLFTVRVMFMQ